VYARNKRGPNKKIETSPLICWLFGGSLHSTNFTCRWFEIKKGGSLTWDGSPITGSCLLYGHVTWQNSHTHRWLQKRYADRLSISFPRLFHFHFPIFPTNVLSYAAPPAGNFRPKFIISAECAADLLPL